MHQMQRDSTMCWSLTPWDAGRWRTMRVEFKGIDDVVQSLQQLAELPDEVIDEMLNARADVIVEAQRAEASKLGMYETKTTHNNTRNTSATNILRGQTQSYSQGTTAKSIKKGKVKIKNGQRVLYVTPTGSRKRGKKNPKRTKNSEIAFLNEYGTRTINARNFIRIANERSADAAVAAEFEVYSRWLESRGL
nr:MAG TPA: hypothetical protein [Caudoviricetes sp.]